MVSLHLDILTWTISAIYPSNICTDDLILAKSSSLAWGTALQEICNRDMVDVSLLDIISPSDRARIEKWNSVQPSTVNDTIHGAFRRQARANPQKQAICAWDGEYTYAELDELTELLAHHLRALGVSKEVIVPFCFNKSLWVVVATVATLKAGGVPVALNPEFPKDHLNLIMRLSDARLVLMGTDTFEEVLVECDRKLVVSAAFVQSLPRPAGHVEEEASPSSAAVIQFTSGTTGITTSASDARAIIVGANTRQELPRAL
jgi:non-ribosomal peptide synthetase component F